MKVAIQGELGAFSHEAALKLEPGAEIVPCALSAEVFGAVTSGVVDAAVIPIEIAVFPGIYHTNCSPQCRHCG